MSIRMRDICDRTGRSFRTVDYAMRRYGPPIRDRDGITRLWVDSDWPHILSAVEHAASRKREIFTPPSE